MSTRNDYWAYLQPQNGDIRHHGVKGMKWGVRHDPVRTGRRRFRTDGSSRKGLTDKQKTALKVAGGAALIIGGTALAVTLAKKQNWTKAGNAEAAKQLSKWGKKPVDKLPDHTEIYRKYGTTYSTHMKNHTPGAKVISTRGRLTGHSQLENKSSASLHRANFYEDRYRRRTNKIIDYQNKIHKPIVDRKQRFYRDEYTNALDQLRRSSGDPLATSGDLGKFYRYRRK